MASPFNGQKLGQTLGDGEEQGSLVYCSPWGHKESDTTWPLNNNNPDSPSFGSFVFKGLFLTIIVTNDGTIL